MNELQALRRVAERAAELGGQELLKWRERFTAQEKAPRDLVTEADLASQHAIFSYLGDECPEHALLGEEAPDLSLLHSAEWLWVVDPLDGTTNYVHGLNAYAVSVALVRRGVPQWGVVWDPVAKECFSAARGEGATLNGQPLRVSGCSQLDQALIAASFPARVEPDREIEQQFLRVLWRCQAIRRLGAAALNLAYLAAGRLDGYWATNVKAWDVAAGFLLVSEAGGRLTDLSGGEVTLTRPRFISTSTEPLYDELLGALRGEAS